MSGIPDAELRISEFEARVAQVRSIIDRHGASAAILATRANFAWLTVGGSGHVLQSSEQAIASILVTRDEVVAICQNMEADRLSEEELTGLGLEVLAVPWWERGAVEREISRRIPRGSRAMADEGLEPDLEVPRSVLSGFDRLRLTVLARSTRDAVDTALASVRTGMDEDDLAAEVLCRLPTVRVPVLLVAADGRIVRHRHPLPGRTAIRARVMVVVVAERFGLHVALTRIRDLEPPSSDIIRRGQAVALIQRAMHDATRPGVPFGAVIRAARRAYDDTGFPDEWQRHHQGGSIGYRARERIAVPDDVTVIQPGMAFAWNPSIAGAKSEETIVLDDDGVCRAITT